MHGVSSAESGSVEDSVAAALAACSRGFTLGSAEQSTCASASGGGCAPWPGRATKQKGRGAEAPRPAYPLLQGSCAAPVRVARGPRVGDYQRAGGLRLMVMMRSTTVT
jgi:hypothetical protein